ncbi:MAG: hypothetical protein WC314_02725 [Vulcanimicrobiota bacterium]
MRAHKSIVFLLLAVLLCAGPALALFGPPTRTLTGRINFVQESNFIVMMGANEFVRVMVAQDRKVPPEVQVGVIVEVEIVQAEDGQWYLNKFNKIGLLPATGR